MKYAELREEDRLRRSDFRFVTGFLDYSKRCSKNEDSARIGAALVLYNAVLATGIAGVMIFGALGLERLVR